MILTPTTSNSGDLANVDLGSGDLPNEGSASGLMGTGDLKSEGLTSGDLGSGNLARDGLGSGDLADMGASSEDQASGELPTDDQAKEDISIGEVLDNQISGDHQISGSDIESNNIKLLSSGSGENSGLNKIELSGENSGEIVSTVEENKIENTTSDDVVESTALADVYVFANITDSKSSENESRDTTLSVTTVKFTATVSSIKETIAKGY